MDPISQSSSYSPAYDWDTIKYLCSKSQNTECLLLKKKSISTSKQNSKGTSDDNTLQIKCQIRRVYGYNTAKELTEKQST